MPVCVLKILPGPDLPTTQYNHISILRHHGSAVAVSTEGASPGEPPIALPIKERRNTFEHVGNCK